RRKLQETQKLQTALLQESAQNEAVLAQLRSVLSTASLGRTSPGAKSEDVESGAVKAATTPSKFEFLNENPSARSLGVGAPSQAPLTTNVNFALSQLPALRSLLSILRPKLRTLPTAATNVDWDGTREERKQYVESQTRRHLERTRGLELNGQGAVRDGEWSGVGRKISAEEVAAMDVIVSMLGPGIREPDDKMEE
ncbi:MAG: hypothetical protein M1830_006385, partial [Pleopsidium flavum]